LAPPTLGLLRPLGALSYPNTGRASRAKRLRASRSASLCPLFAWG